MTNVGSQKGFKMFYLNIRSLVNKYEQLKIELEKPKIKIFSTSETWLTAGVNSKILQISGYNIRRRDRAMVDIDTPENSTCVFTSFPPVKTGAVLIPS